MYVSSIHTADSIILQGPLHVRNYMYLTVLRAGISLLDLGSGVNLKPSHMHPWMHACVYACWHLICIITVDTRESASRISEAAALTS